MNNLKLKIAAGMSAVAGAVMFIPHLVGATTLSSSTLGSAIDTLNGTTYDYFLVLLDKMWPFVVGFSILVGVWYFGRHIVRSFR